MKALVIYDTTGRIWNIIYGEETLPQGLTCMFVDIPDGAQLERIDVIDPQNPQPVFTYLPESDIGKLQKEVKEIQNMIDPVFDVEAATLDELKNYTQTKNKLALAEFLSTHPLLWTDGEYYGVTQEDQIEMSIDLSAYQIMHAADSTWELEWHNIKKACRAFTLDEYNQLLAAIIAFVYPYRRLQESYKEAIYNSATKEEVLNINMDYSEDALNQNESTE